MNLILKALIILFLLFSQGTIARAEFEENSIPNLDIYKIDTSLVNNYNVIKKGTQLNLTLLNDVYTGRDKNNSSISFAIPTGNGQNLRATGFIAMTSRGKRMSRHGTLEISTNKLYLEDGQEIYFSASSPLFKGLHPPHANNSSLRLARTITNLAIASSPATFGASLGISFLASGLLSAYQNGPQDFLWGGLDGSGLSIVEDIFRRQPDIYLQGGSTIPFVLKRDLKISKGIHKEEVRNLNIEQEEAITKINKLIEWGDLTGALELAAKTNQKEIYDKIMRKIGAAS